MVISEENKTENNSELSKQLDVIEFVENMADINLKTLKLHGLTERKDSSINDSFMTYWKTYWKMKYPRQILSLHTYLGP